MGDSGQVIRFNVDNLLFGVSNSGLQSRHKAEGGRVRNWW